MWKRLTVALLLAVLLTTALTLIVENTMNADGPDGEDFNKIIELIDQKEDNVPIELTENAKLEIPSDPKGGITYRLQHANIDAKTGDYTTQSFDVVRFYMPVTDSHKFKSVQDSGRLAIYAGNSYHLAVKAAHNGFSAYIAILDETAPSAYSFRYELPTGFKLSEDGKGGIDILNGEDAIVGAILHPWAYDANGSVVKTEFKLVGDSLVQTVNHAGATYPVVADPSTAVGWFLAKTQLHTPERAWCFASNARERICREAYGHHGAVANFTAIRLFGPLLRNGRSDAFKHCYWAARMTRGMGRRTAGIILDLHEQEPGQPLAELRMDNWNNAKGKQLGVAVLSYYQAKTWCELWSLDNSGPLQLSLTDYRRFE